MFISCVSRLKRYVILSYSVAYVTHHHHHHHDKLVIPTIIMIIFPKNLIPWCKFFCKKVIYFVSEAKCGSTWAAKWTIACFKQGHLRAQSACYELKGDLSPVMLKEIFHDSLKISKFTRICMENPSSVSGWQKLFFSYKSFQFSAAVAIATSEIYGWKCTGYLILICSFSSC